MIARKWGPTYDVRLGKIGNGNGDSLSCNLKIRRRECDRMYSKRGDHIDSGEDVFYCVKFLLKTNVAINQEKEMFSVLTPAAGSDGKLKLIQFGTHVFEVIPLTDICNSSYHEGLPCVTKEVEQILATTGFLQISVLTTNHKAP